METPIEFEILIRRKMPFASSFLNGMIIFLLFFLVLFYLVNVPATYSRSSLEMQTAYYISFVPDELKTLSFYSFVGLIIVTPLYYRVRLHKPAILQVGEGSLHITGKKIGIEIPKRRIRKIYFNDLKNAFGKEKRKLQIVIQQGTTKNTTFRLIHYEQGGKLIEAFSSLENVEFIGYDDYMVGDHEDDE